MKVLVSNPSFEKETIWLPYLWGRLRLQTTADVEWLDPIFFADSAEQLAAPYGKVDLLLLSCYVWNWKKNLEIAEIIKQRNPNCIVVAGGPQVTPTADYDICDVVWAGESENTIDSIIAGNYDMPASRVQLDQLESPYIKYINDYKRFAKQIVAATNKPPAAIWETNRGCPYSCTFCDWGSLTNSKIRRFSDHTIFDDIDALSEIGVGMVFNADANFGIFNDDLKYVERMVANKQATGYPKSLFFSSAKNKKTIAAKAAKLLFDNDMISTLQISYQHTDSDVLKAIRRDNISTDQIQQELKAGFENGIPLVGVVIMGNPQDTFYKWIKGIDDLLSIGFHEDIRYHDFMVLPNAPAAEPLYRKKYGIKTIRKPYYSLSRYPVGQPPHQFEAEFISATNTMSEEDMVQVQTYTSFVVGMHNLNVTRFIAMLLNKHYNVKYSNFYLTLSEQPQMSFLYEEVANHYRDFIIGDREEKSIEYCGEMIPTDFYFKAIATQWLHQNKITEEIINTIVSVSSLTYDQAADLVELQKRTIVGWWGQKDIVTRYNFIEAFANEQWTLQDKPCVLRSNQTHVGQFVKRSITDLTSFETWFRSNLHKKQNVRSKMNHYEQLFQSL